MNYRMSVASFKMEVTEWSNCDGVGTVYKAKTLLTWLLGKGPPSNPVLSVYQNYLKWFWA